MKLMKNVAIFLLTAVICISLLSYATVAEASPIETENLSSTSTITTRADLENAIAETAWAFYMKDVWIQYDSIDLNTRVDGSNLPMTRWMSGFTRLDNHLTTLEDANSDENIYSVCSYMPWAVYYEVLDYPLLGNSLNASSMGLWLYSEMPDDMLVLRHHNWEEGTNISDLETGYVSHDKCVNREELEEFLLNWEENLRPGDIFYVIDGHAAMYVGNGYIFESGGRKLNLVTGADTLEANGSIYAWTVEDYFFNENSGSLYNLNNLDASTPARIAILRPLDLLTEDDGDGNPDNDIIDEQYELELGRLNLTFSSDPNELRTSGFSLQDSAVSRVNFPAMNIDKTVNITPYGTAEKNGNLTYTVSITNESNNPNYVAYHSVGSETTYTGSAYSDLSITESIPENTVLVSAPGAQQEGNTLRWTIDVPVGETVAITYTVKVTGDIGDKVVNVGGYVDNIPTNTISNTIGGSKLDSESTTQMQTFFAAGKESWNSNEGYRISANVNEGTHFAERIYNEAAGLNLQIPEVQELADMLFTQELIEEDQGMYYSYEVDVSRYMYTLNENTADPANQIFRDMVIDGYYGGVWVWTNVYAGEPRIDEMRFDYLEPGDILVYMTLEDSSSNGTDMEDRDVTEWRVLVYLGDGKLASLTEIGRLSAVTDNSALLSAFTYDLFVALRPSQVYTDINTSVEAFAGPAAELGDDDKAWEYEPNISTVLMNEELIARLAALTSNGWTQVNTGFVGEVYSALGIPEPASGVWSVSYASILKAIFQDIPDDSEAYATYQHAYHLMDEPNTGSETIYDMLLYYDGPAYVDKNPVTSLEELHPGDAVLLGLRRERHYMAAVYQGDGKFLTGLQSLSGGVFNYGNIHGDLDFDSDEEFQEWLYGPINAEDPNHPNVCYEGYLVLRPSRVYENINATAVRDLKDGPLTDAEYTALANITKAEWNKDGNPVNLHNVAAWVYGEAKVSVSSYLNASIYWTYSALFDSQAMLRTENDPEYNANFRIMLVDGLYGGTNFGTSGKSVLSASDFEIGDLFAAAKQIDGVTCYWTAMYQGNGKFLVVENNYGSPRCFIDDGAFFTGNFTSQWQYFYVLRPNQLTGPTVVAPRDIKTGALTDAEIAILASLSVDDWEDGGKQVNLTGAGKWFYNSANVDMSPYLNKTIWNAYSALFVETAGVSTLRPETDTAFVADLNTMLVEGFYGGSKFGESGKSTLSASDFAIGDIFAGAKNADGGGTCYWTALYQGNGKFLVVQNFGGGNSTQSSCFIDTTSFYTEIFADQWLFFYVLRPNQLVVPAVVIPRDIKTGALTDAETAILANLSVDDWEDGGKQVNLTGAGKWFYNSANVDMNPYLNKTIWNAYSALFVETAGVSTLRPETDTAFVADLNTMLVEGFYGGSKFGESGKSTISVSDFAIGDIFAGAKNADGGGTCYWTALYQGNGKFLVVQNFGGGNSTQSSCFIDTTSFYTETFADQWQFFYVLRPNQLVTVE